MFKTILKFTTILFLCVSMYFLSTFYFSEKNKKEIYLNRTIVESKIKNNITNLPILKNDTDNVIEFNTEFKRGKSEKKRNFWNLFKINE